MKRIFAPLLVAFCILPSLASANIAYDKVDTNQDGFITHEEHQAMMNEFFVRMDTNSDGKISRKEFETAKEKHCKKLASNGRCENYQDDSG